MLNIMCDCCPFDINLHDIFKRIINCFFNRIGDFFSLA